MALEKVALESKSRRGSRGSYEFISVRIAKNLTKVLSMIISINLVSFTDFEANFVILFKQKCPKT